MTGVAALIVAAGRGTRLGSELPKQYLDLGGRTVLARCLDRFLDLPELACLRVVIAEGDRALYDDAVADIGDARLLPPVTGGETRDASVRVGLESLVPEAPDRVLIHDAARPFTPASVIRGVIAALDEADGAVAALPVVDALFRAEGGEVAAPVDRGGLWRAQTPQGFRFGAILDAHRHHRAGAADDVEVARAAGLAVAVAPGSEEGFKITTAADLDRAQRLLAPR